MDSWPTELQVDLVRLVRRRPYDQLSYYVYACYDDSNEQVLIAVLNLCGHANVVLFVREVMDMDLKDLTKAHTELHVIAARGAK